MSRSRLPLVFWLLFFTTQVLAQSQNIIHEIELPLYDGERYLGEVGVGISEDKLHWIRKSSLLQILKENLASDTFKQMEKLPEQLNPQSLPLPVTFDQAELKLNMPMKLEQRSRSDVNMLENYQHNYGKEALEPSPFGGAINYRLEQNYSSHPGEEDYFSGQINSFLNMNTLVLESQAFYQSNHQRKWFRSDTRLVKDFERQQVRYQAGDIYPQVQGFMSPRAMGGVSVSRNFSLNPYRLPYPTGEQNFSLNARSLVKYFVNGSLIRSEYLPAGNYTARDIPLNNGLNIVTIEATDDLGQKKVFVFRSAASINLLNRGESRFDLSHGIPFLDENFKREYDEEDGKLTTGFYQYGFSSQFSATVYGQNQKDFSLLGGELIQATAIGNFSAGHASSLQPQDNGQAQSLSYQLIGQGSSWIASQTLGLRYEHRSEKFKTGLRDLSSSVQNNYAINYTLPLASVLTASIGGNYGDVRDNNLSDRYGFDSTLNLRILEHHNLSLFVGRNRDENKQWNDVAYVFLTIAFPGSNDFVSTFYDQQQESAKLTYIKDNQARLYSPKAQAILEKNNMMDAAEADVTFPTPFADFGGRIRGQHSTENHVVDSRGSLRLNSALVFAYDDGDLGLGVSRPITNSFVLFKPEPRLKDQRIGLRSTSPYSESESGLFNEITFSNLLAYQFREVQLDPTLMEEGRTLKKEKFVIYPTYRSAHLIKLEETGTVILQGTLLKQDGTPWSLQVGHLNGSKPFFTNRDGEFFIEGVEPGSYELRLDGVENTTTIAIPAEARGMKDIGTLSIEEER